MTLTMDVCAAPGCEQPLPPSKGPIARKWCSDRCRKRQYDRPCIDCGVPVDGTTPSMMGGRCTDCHNRRERELSRRWILDSMREWHDLFGEPPVALDWNQTMARATGALWRVERYGQTDRPWPSVWLVQSIFGSWNAGVVAAGFEPLPPGSGRRGRS